MNYKKMRDELEYAIRNEIDLAITANPDENPSVTDRIVLSSLRRMESIMKQIKERYEEEEA